MDRLSQIVQDLSAKGTIEPEYVDSINDGDSFRLAVKGEQIFKMIAHSVSTARREVLIQTFAWESNIYAVSLLKTALLDAANALDLDSEPIKVFIQIDERGPISTLAFNRRKYVEWELNIDSIGLTEHEKLDIQISTYYHDSIASNHAKTIIIDGETLIMTGANFQSSNFHHIPAHEAAYLIKGPVAISARKDFIYMWGLRKNPMNTQDILENLDNLNNLNNLDNPLRVLFLTRLPQVIRSVNFIDNPQNGAIEYLIENAQNVIRIATPNLNAKFISRALIDFVNRGGRLELLLGHSFNDKRESVIFIGGTNQTTVDKIYRKVGPDNMKNLVIRWYSIDGINPVIGNVAGASHLKFMAIDNAFLLVGNSNLDVASMTHLHEVNIVIESEQITQYVTENVFESEFERGIKATQSMSSLESIKHYVGFRGFQQNLANSYRTTIVAITDESNGFKTLKLVRPDGFNFKPGQYAQIRVIRDKAHIFNSSLLAIASGVSDPYLEITARSSKLPWKPNKSLDKSVGDSIRFEGPIGTYFPLDNDLDILLIGGGSGITPLRSVIRSIQDRNYELIYSTKTMDALLYSDEIVGKPNHTISFTQEDKNKEGLGFSNLRVTDILMNKDIDENILIFVCGPVQLVKDVRNILLSKNVEAHRIYCSLPFDALRGGPIYRGDNPCFE